METTYEKNGRASNPFAPVQHVMREYTTIVVFAVMIAAIVSN